jgi:hypothetical protein
MDKAADFDTKSLSPHSKGLKPNFKNYRVVLMIDVHISLVAKIAFICFLKSLCSFSPFVTFCHSGHVDAAYLLHPLGTPRASGLIARPSPANATNARRLDNRQINVTHDFTGRTLVRDHARLDTHLAVY